MGLTWEGAEVAVMLMDHQCIPQQALYWYVPRYNGCIVSKRSRWATTTTTTKIQGRTRSTTNKLKRHSQQRSTKDGVDLEASKGASSWQTLMASECGPVCPVGCGMSQGHGKGHIGSPGEDLWDLLLQICIDQMLYLLPSQQDEAHWKDFVVITRAHSFPRKILPNSAVQFRGSPRQNCPNSMAYCNLPFVCKLSFILSENFIFCRLAWCSLC